MTLYPITTPPPQTTAIYRDFKKSTAISKGYNVGLRYIINIEEYHAFLLLYDLGQPLPPVLASLGEHGPVEQREEKIREKEGRTIV